MRISDWSSDVCSSDLGLEELRRIGACPHLARTASHDPCQLPEPGRSVDRRLAEAALRPEMAGRTCWLRRDEQGVPIAIGTNVLHADRKSVVEGKRVAVRVVPGGRRLIKKKKHK